MLDLQNRSLATIGAILATFATVVAASPARAEPGSANASVRIRYNDLDLASRAGASTLEHRIHVAARRVCGAEDAMMHRAVARCRREAVARAAASLPAAQAAVLLAAR